MFEDIEPRYEPRWTIEPHGKGYALYSGRDNHHHGLNLVHLSEPDMNWEQTKAMIEAAPVLHAKVQSMEEEMVKLKEELAKKEHTIMDLNHKIQDLQAYHDYEYQRMLEWRHIIEEYGHVVCEKCGGSGVFLYSDTGTWRNAIIVGRAMTTDICDCCWGSGISNKPGVNLLDLYDRTT